MRQLRIVTLKKAAHETGISIPTLRRMVRSGKLKRYTNGEKLVCISMVEFEKLATAGTKEKVGD